MILSGEAGAVTGKYFIPTDETLGRDWTQPGFDDAGWASGPLGIGFEIGNDNYTDLIKTDLGDQLQGHTSLYARIPFTVDDPAALKGLSLRMKYEDGYVAYINGTEVYRTGLREDDPTFDSTSRSRSARVAVEFENVNLSQFLNLLQPGENLLAIHGLNASATSNDMFFLPELVNGALSSSNGEIPLAQAGNPKIDIATIEFNPASGNQQEEYIQITNNNEFSVDISDWRLEGDVEWTFDPGTVLPAGFTLYATPDAKAFRARTEGPTGGMGLFVQGNYKGHLPNIGGSVQLVGRDGALVSEASYEGTVSTLQENLRISEVMYNPMEANAAELAQDSSLISEDFEYIELVNISETETLDLTGAHFSSGVQFDFTNSAVTQLARVSVCWWFATRASLNCVMDSSRSIASLAFSLPTPPYATRASRLPWLRATTRKLSTSPTPTTPMKAGQPGPMARAVRCKLSTRVATLRNRQTGEQAVRSAAHPVPPNRRSWARS